MTISARSDSDLTLSARRVQWVPMKGRGTATAGSYAYEGGALVTGWHSHEVHQIEYAIGGIAEVETPPVTIWSPATGHLVARRSRARHPSQGDVTTLSVLFEPALIPGYADRARILAVSPLMQEMLVYSLRWPFADTAAEPRSERFFRTLADLVVDALAAETPLLLPTSDDPLVAAAMRYTRDHLATVTIEDVSRAVSVSERTLRRMFTASVAMSWRDYLTSARMLRAMTLLATREQTVSSTATAVGFDSQGRSPGHSPSSAGRRHRPIAAGSGRAPSSRAEVCALIGHSLPRAGAESLQCSRD